MNKQKMQRLGIFEEAVHESGFLIAEISRFEIVLPLELEDKLLLLVGKRIEILRTDVPGKEYLVMGIPKISPVMDEINMIDLAVSKAQREKGIA